MKSKDKTRIIPSLIEMLVIMVLLMTVFELTKQYLYSNVTVFQWHIVTVFFAALTACLILYFILRRHIKHNRKLILEIKYLKRMEEELKGKVNELSNFKDLVVWWGKRINEIQDEMKTLKKELGKHEISSKDKKTTEDTAPGQ